MILQVGGKSLRRQRRKKQGGNLDFLVPLGLLAANQYIKSRKNRKNRKGKSKKTLKRKSNKKSRSKRR
jgi:hypothetical protein